MTQSDRSPGESDPGSCAPIPDVPDDAPTLRILASSETAAVPLPVALAPLGYPGEASPMPASPGGPGHRGRWGTPGTLRWRLRVSWALLRLAIARRLRMAVLQVRLWLRPIRTPSDPAS
jgi:hypothetical protein